MAFGRPHTRTHDGTRTRIFRDMNSGVLPIVTPHAKLEERQDPYGSGWLAKPASRLLSWPNAIFQVSLVRFELTHSSAQTRRNTKLSHRLLSCCWYNLTTLSSLVSTTLTALTFRAESTSIPHMEDETETQWAVRHTEIGFITPCMSREHAEEAAKMAEEWVNRSVFEVVTRTVTSWRRVEG